MKTKNRKETKRGRGNGRREFRKNGAFGRNDGKRNQNSPSRRWRIGSVVLVSCLLIFSVSFLAWNSSTVTSQPGQQTDVGVSKAVILDGLYSGSEDLTFEQELTSMLEHSTTEHYQVDVFRRENVTVDLLKNIEGYKILILRVHSAIGNDRCLYLFSGENFTTDKYLVERSMGAVREGKPYGGKNESYFALNAAFVSANKPNGLKDSTIILMGCKGMGDTYSVERLLGKGVKAYVAWNGDVDLSHSDEATIALAEALYQDNLSVKAAVQKVMMEVGPDSYFGSELEYRPLQ